MIHEPIRRGTREYRHLALAMLLAGYSTFSLLFCVQPLLPAFAHDFDLSAEAASLAVSCTTVALAVAIVAAGALSDRVGRRTIMCVSLLAAAAVTLASAFAPSWMGLLAFRLLTGAVLAGVPALALAYVADEVEPSDSGPATGLYIAGTAVGGMAGRLEASLISHALDWRWALAGVGAAALIAALAFWRLAPAARGFAPRAPEHGGLVAGARALLADAALPWLYLEAFLLMGAFITIYNYVSFRLLAPPYRLSEAAVGAIFLLYLLGSASSLGFGELAGRFGRRRVFWVPVTLLLAGVLGTAAEPLWAVVTGVALVTLGFFGAHAIASGWVGRRAGARRGQGAALYLLFYYTGASVLGSAGGVAWTRWGWTGVTVFVVGLTLLSLLAAARLARVAPASPAASRG